MYSFGKIPPRAPRSPGVAGILGAECRVYYDHLFSSTGLGRVADLLAARLREHGLDELRFRAVVLFTFFEAYRAQSQGEALNEPLTIECGIDGEKIAVGISFSLPQPAELKIENLAQRIALQPENGFEALLATLHSHSDHTLLRFNPQTGTVEVISLLALPGQIGIQEKQELTLILPEEGQATSSAAEAEAEAGTQAQEYIQLGDLDYGDLLKEEGGRPKKAAFSTGEIMARGFSPEKQEKDEGTAISREPSEHPEALTVAGGPQDSDGSVRISGTAQEPSGKTIVSGSAETIDQGMVRIGSGEKIETDSSKIVISGRGFSEDQRREISHLSAPESGTASGQVQPEHGESQQEGKSPENASGEWQGFSVKGMLEKVWPFNRRKDQQRKDEVSDEGIPSASQQAEGEKASTKTAPGLSSAEEPSGPETTWGGAIPLPPFDEGDIKGMAQYILTDVSAGNFAKLVERAHEKAREIKKDSSNGSLKRWMEGFSQEILSEKARLMELSKKIAHSVRQKEHEIKNRERTFADDLRRKDEQIHQKTIALDRAKEQLSHANSQVEKYKAAKVVSNEESNFRQKYQLAQRMVSTLRDDNSKLTAKLEEVRSQVTNLTNHKASDTGMVVELANLKTKNDQLTRQYMQIKGLNEQLLRRMAQSSQKKASEKAESMKVASKAASGSDETKRRLETAMKLANAQQKEIDQLHQKIEQFAQEESRLKGDLNRLQGELRTTKLALEAAQKLLSEPKKAG